VGDLQTKMGHKSVLVG